jgi:hypothetical protein
MGTIQIQRAFSSLFRLFQLNTGLSKLPRHVKRVGHCGAIIGIVHNAFRHRVFRVETDLGGAGHLPKPSGVLQAQTSY